MPKASRYACPALACGLLVFTALTARVAHAEPACGAPYLGLEEGVKWTYEREVPEDGEDMVGEMDLALELPTELIVEVTSISRDGDTTEIALREVFGDIEQNTEITCEDDDINVSPQSFLSVGEPGGGVGVTLVEGERRGSSFPADLRGSQWREWVEFEFEQEAAPGSGAEHPSGKIQIAREVRALGRVPLELGDESYRPYRVDFELEGRAMIEPNPDRAVEIPADSRGALWFEPGLGLVRAINRFGHDWTLVAHSGDDDDGDDD